MVRISRSVLITGRSGSICLGQHFGLAGIAQELQGALRAFAAFRTNAELFPQITHSRAASLGGKGDNFTFSDSLADAQVHDALVRQYMVTRIMTETGIVRNTISEIGAGGMDGSEIRHVAWSVFRVVETFGWTLKKMTDQ
jgi:hypothetical protein